MAGTEEDLNSAQLLANYWRKNNLDSVQIVSYDILLDRPKNDIFNSIDILNSNAETEVVHEIKEKTFDKDLDYSQISKPFLAFSKNGSITAVLYFLFDA